MPTKNIQAEQQYKQRQYINHDNGLPERESPEAMAIDSTMKFSFVFPTRERPHLLKNLLDSFVKNTDNMEEIEVLIAVDNDDRDSFNFLCSAGYPFVKVYQVSRSLNFSRDYYSFLATKSTGRWIITINDDCVMETPSWDTKAYEVLKDKPGVVYGWIQDGIDGYRARGHGNYCCFPLFGREGYEALGYIFPTRVPTWGADIWAKNLYDQINSVVEIPITLRHYCHHNKTREQDHISKRIANSQVPFDMRPTYDEVNKLLAAKRKELVRS